MKLKIDGILMLKNLLEIKRAKELDVIESMKQKIKKSKKRSKIKGYESRLLDFQNDPKTKMILEFDQCVACSIKSLAVNKNNVIELTLIFFNGRMLMFTKLSLMSFAYELIEVFYFPDKKVKKNICKIFD